MAYHAARVAVLQHRAVGLQDAGNLCPIGWLVPEEVTINLPARKDVYGHPEMDSILNTTTNSRFIAVECCLKETCFERRKSTRILRMTRNVW